MYSYAERTSLCNRKSCGAARTAFRAEENGGNRLTLNQIRTSDRSSGAAVSSRTSQQAVQLCGRSRYYQQSTDPTLTPYIKPGEHFMGQAAMTSGNPADVRVASVDHRGMHEVLPTNKTSKVHASPIPGVRGIQSGLRTPTDMTLFQLPRGNIAAHTNAVKRADGHNALLAGQADAHDMHRSSFDALPATSTMEQATASLSASFVHSMPTGQTLYQSPQLTGLYSAASGLPFGAPSTPERMKAIEPLHKSREGIKANTRAYADENHVQLPRPLSPPRLPMSMGGGYVPTGTPVPAVSVPLFPGSNPDEIAANASAWITKPARDFHP